MIVLGNDDPRTAEYAADLFLEGWAPLVLVTGKDGSGTKGKNVTAKIILIEVFFVFLFQKLFMFLI